MPFYPCPKCGQPVDLAQGVCSHDGTDLRATPPSSSTSIPVATETLPLGLLPAAGPADTEPDQVLEASPVAETLAPSSRLEMARTMSASRIEPEPSHDPYIGVSLGRYRLERRVGEGGWGAVYQARHEGLGQLVAVKVLTGLSRVDQPSLTRLISEGRAAAKIGHPNIVKIIDDGFHPDVGPYIVMEMLQGASLEDTLKRKRISEREACTIALQVADALAAAHAHRIVHRDVKPANIFLEAHAAGEVAKVLDFGIAKFEGAVEGTPTEAGAILGTPRYMSPEQWTGQLIDTRSDVYSFGIVLYQMLTGRLPFPEAKTLLLLAMHVQTELSPKAEAITVGLDPRLAALISDCTVVDREQRVRTMTEAVSVLRAVLATSANVPLRVLPPSPASEIRAQATGPHAQAALPRPRVARWATISAAIAAGVAALFVVFAQFRGPPAPRPSLPAAQAPQLFVPDAGPPPTELFPAPTASTLSGKPASGSQSSSSAAAKGTRSPKHSPQVEDSRGLLYTDGDPLVKH